MPLMRTAPSDTSINRDRRFTMVVLPEPVEPMTARVRPAAQWNETPESTACSAPG